MWALKGRRRMLATSSGGVSYCRVKGLEKEARKQGVRKGRATRVKYERDCPDRWRKKG
jgi:hypothetical protein